MSAVWLILTMGASVYALRLAGLALPDRLVPTAWERALGFVPVAVLTALVVTSLLARPESGPARMLAAAGAGLVARCTGRMWACILSGMVLYWLLRFAGV